MDNGKRSQQEAKKIKSPTSKKEERSTMKSTLFGYQCFRGEKKNTQKITPLQKQHHTTEGEKRSMHLLDKGRNLGHNTT